MTMTQEERELYDARADHEAWCLAHDILEPWVRATERIGSPELSRVMENALSEVEAEINRTLDVLEPLEELKFDVVGYGCTTCIGNSGPLAEEISEAVNENDLVVAAVLSGNRNFEGRINPDVRANYLASPPLVVAYALAGTVDIDLSRDPLGEDSDGNPVYLKDIWPSQEEVAREIENALDPEIFKEQYADVYTGNQQWNEVQVPEGDLYEWDPDSTYIQEPSFFKDMGPDPEDLKDIEGATIELRRAQQVQREIELKYAKEIDAAKGEAAQNNINVGEFDQYFTGMDTIAATLEAARLRFRPILMTSLAFILGVSPLAFSTGAGAGARHSVGTGVMGGMLAATFIATLFIPLFFVLVARRRKERK